MRCNIEIQTVIILLITTINVFAIEPGEVYYGVDTWKRLSGNRKDLIEGQTYVEISILTKQADTIEIHIFKKQNPFGEYLDFTILANDKQGVYYFEGTDNWLNIINGYLIAESEKMLFNITCSEYHEYGLKFARLYDEVTILEKKK